VTLLANGGFTFDPKPGFTGTDTFDYSVTNGQTPNDTATVTIVVGCGSITVTNPVTSSGTVDAAFSQTFTQTDGVGATTFTLNSGSLPAGLSPSTGGVLSSPASRTGTFPITVKATDSNGCTGIGPTYNLTIACQTITVTQPGTTTGAVDTAFSQTFTQTGAHGTPSFTTASTLPAGLVLAANGTLSGTPTENGAFPITVTVTDDNGCTGTGNTYNLVIDPGPGAALESSIIRTTIQNAGSFNGDNANPLDTAEYFVRQQYVDVLSREPDEAGFNFWSDRILVCGNDAECVRRQRVAVAAQFFIAQEFQQSGSYIYNLYEEALSRSPLFAEYAIDRQQVAGGAELEAEKQAFAESFVQRSEFSTKYQANMAPDSFVDALIANLRQGWGVDLASQRDAMIVHYKVGANQIQSRSFVLRDVTENQLTRATQYNAGFVLTEYFGYLQRNPDRGGYSFWLNAVNNGEAGNYNRMVCAFVTSAEYQRRFSRVVSRGNGECGPELWMSNSSLTRLAGISEKINSFVRNRAGFCDDS
jgi:hypothetical protein